MVSEKIIMNTAAVQGEVGRKALALIAEYFGAYTSELYQNFYSTKSDQEVMASIQELLIEQLGQQKSQELMLKNFGLFLS